jgi:serine beta-lactamase-like protein LACTB
LETKKTRIPTWLALLAGAVSLPFLIAGALWQYMSATATPIHPNPLDVKSVTTAAPLAHWTEAVAQARQQVRAGLAEQNLPGVSVAVSVGQDIVWTEGFGWADIDEEMRVTPETRFRIGTASTMLTSAAAGLLLEKGRLRLDEKIQTYVPEFPEKKWPVTLRHVMGHLAGIRSDGGDEGPLFSQHCKRPVEAVPAFAEKALLFEPGTKYRFSTYGWILMSAVVEAAAGEPFLTFMSKQVFGPLGMADTVPDDGTADVEPRPTPGRASSYFPKFAADPRYGPDPMRPLDYSCYAGSSVFLSTASDLVRFAMAMKTGAFLQPATVELLQTSQRLPSGEETGYGLGWDLETVTISGKQTALIGHDGDLLAGMAVSLMDFREYGIVVAILSNTSYADTFSIGVKVAQAFAAPQNPSTKAKTR